MQHVVDRLTVWLSVLTAQANAQRSRTSRPRAPRDGACSMWRPGSFGRGYPAPVDLCEPSGDAFTVWLRQAVQDGPGQSHLERPGGVDLTRVALAAARKSDGILVGTSDNGDYESLPMRTLEQRTHLK